MIDYLITNWYSISQSILTFTGAASVIIKLTPTLKDDNILLPIIKFISKYVALNTNTPSKRPK